MPSPASLAASSRTSRPRSPPALNANGLNLSDTAARKLVERGVERLDGGYRWSSDPRLTLASPIRVTEAQVQAWLAGIRCDTLLLLADPPAPFLNPEMVEKRVQAVASPGDAASAGQPSSAPGGPGARRTGNRRIPRVAAQGRVIQAPPSRHS